MLFEITFHGDLEHLSSQIYPTFQKALLDLATEWNWCGYGKQFTDKFGAKYSRHPHYPDPEDDRIVIWEISESLGRVAVWHFSGWHWNFDAEDLPGGPLEQGTLDSLPFGRDWFKGKSIYTLCMEDY